MNIGFDAKRLYNNFTGLGNYSRTTIDILTEYFPENAYILFTPKVNQRAKLYINKEHCTIVSPQGFIRGSLWRTFSIPSELKRRDRVDVFHGLSNELPIGIRRSGVPSVVTIHDVAFHTFPDMYHYFDRKIYDAKWHYAVKNADRIIAISECTKRDILHYYDVDESRISVVYQPVSNRYYTPMDKDEAKLRLQSANFLPSSDFILYVGSINSRKNLLGAIKALELLPGDLQLPLVVVGGGHEYKNEVLRYIHAHHLEDLVIFPSSHFDSDILQALYTEARLFVYPSFYEGFGLPVVEAMLSGCPVVTSNVSSLPEAGGPYSLQADPHSVEDIKDKMQQAIVDDDLRRSIITHGRSYALQTFHPEALSNQLIEVYNMVLS